jgi:hypothetical protein
MPHPLSDYCQQSGQSQGVKTKKSKLQKRRPAQNERVDVSKETLPFMPEGTKRVGTITQIGSPAVILGITTRVVRRIVPKRRPPIGQAGWEPRSPCRRRGVIGASLYVSTQRVKKQARISPYDKLVKIHETSRVA